MLCKLTNNLVGAKQSKFIIDILQNYSENQENIEM